MRSRKFVRGAFLLLVCLVVAALATACGSQARAASSDQARATGGDPVRGQAAIVRNGCGACHMIPGISNAQGLVGPPLLYWSRRGFIAGQLQNTPDNLMRWLKDPQAVERGTDMPNLQLTDEDIRDIASYLYTIK
jgi:cytochrome c